MEWPCLIFGIIIGFVVGVLAKKALSADQMLHHLRDVLMPGLDVGECYYIEVGKERIEEEEDEDDDDGGDTKITPVPSFDVQRN